jgi:hypothetical protein
MIIYLKAENLLFEKAEDVTRKKLEKETAKLKKVYLKSM